MRRLAVLAALLAITAAAAPAWAAPRLRSPDLRYRGAFLLPEQVGERETFAYGGTALAYNPVQRSLFVVGHDWYQLTAEVTVPRPVRSRRLSDLRRARFRQRFADATSGKGDGNKIGGQLVFRRRLFGTVYVYYDAAGEQVRSHWARPSTSLRRGTATGLSRVGNVGAGFVSGYMGEVPRAWRKRLGGPALTGNCCIPIISRTSFGPAAFAFDPRRPRRARPLVYYPQDHPTLGAWDGSWNPARRVLFNGSTQIKGVVFPRGTRSVLFFGTQGTGRFCYGDGSACGDPDDGSKGVHAYPYAAYVWAYSANSLRAVRRRKRRPWQVRPYAVWRLRLPFDSERIGGAAYDPKRQRIFVSQQL
jgi:hypothetical protein